MAEKEGGGRSWDSKLSPSRLRFKSNKEVPKGNWEKFSRNSNH